MIGLIDYNMGNLRSVSNAFEKLGVSVNIIQKAEEIALCDKIILPGVGAFKDAMQCLKEREMDEAIRDFATSHKPLIGICLGMQLLFESSVEFGKSVGLGLIEGEIEAPKVRYCINKENWEKAQVLLAKFFDKKEVKKVCCG